MWEYSRNHTKEWDTLLMNMDRAKKYTLTLVVNKPVTKSYMT
jgi:hypothetical protein